MGDTFFYNVDLIYIKSLFQYASISYDIFISTETALKVNSISRMKSITKEIYRKVNFHRDTTGVYIIINSL